MPVSFLKSCVPERAFGHLRTSMSMTGSPLLRWISERRAARARARADDRVRDAEQSSTSSSLGASLVPVVDIRRNSGSVRHAEVYSRQRHSDAFTRERSSPEGNVSNAPSRDQVDADARMSARSARRRNRRDRAGHHPRQALDSMSSTTASAGRLEARLDARFEARWERMEARRNRSRAALSRPPLVEPSFLNDANMIDVSSRFARDNANSEDTGDRSREDTAANNGNAIESGLAVSRPYRSRYAVEIRRNLRSNAITGADDSSRRDFLHSLSSRSDITEALTEHSSAQTTENAYPMNNNGSDMLEDERRWILAEVLQLLSMHIPDRIVRGDSHLASQFPTFSVEKGTVLVGVSSCPICLEELSGEVTLLPCFCSGHAECMKNAIKNDVRCPIHRIDIRKHLIYDPVCDVDSTMATDGASNISASQNPSASNP